MGLPAELPPMPHAQMHLDAPQRRDRAATVVWAVFACLGLLLAAYLVFLIERRSWQFSALFDGWFVVAFELVATLLCVARAVGRRRHWRVALIMGGACLSWTIGDLVLTLESLGGATPSTPSLADVFYLGFFPLALIAILLYTREEIRRGEQPNWLDGAIAALGMAALCSGGGVHGLEILVFAMSMWVGDGRSNRLNLQSLSGFVLPAFVTCSSLVILVIGNATHLGPLAVGLATITLVLTGIRLAFRPALQKAREQLRSTEERYRMLFEQNPQPMAAYDRHTLEIVAVNDAMLDKYGYSRDELHAMLIKDLLPAEEADMLLRFLDAHPEGVRPEDATSKEWSELRHHRLKDGTLIDIEVTSNNLEIDGRECRIAIFVDVTERNKTARELAVARDRAVEASNMKSAFLANMSHEIRTPMNGVIGMNDLLLRSDLSGVQRQYAEQVARSGDQMLSLINDILDIAKLEAGHIELDLGDFNLHETIEQTCSVAAMQARDKGLRFELEFEPEVPQHVRGDSRRLQQVLLNLVSNAVKFTSEGSVGVRVHATSDAGHATRIRVAVADTGIGIDSASLERMFEPFTQADVSTTRIYGGTGLGLAIVRELVQLLGGTISAESEPGQGSVFRFEFELEGPHAPSVPATQNPSAALSPSWINTPLVLVAEDSTVNQIVAARALERCGCRAEVVADGREALRALAANRYDAVLMDCQMPVMDGYEATSELRRREDGERHTPVIAMTAHAMDGDRERCLAAGMDDYVSKPMRHADLVEALMRCIPQMPVSARNGNGNGTGDGAPLLTVRGFSGER